MNFAASQPMIIAQRILCAGTAVITSPKTTVTTTTAKTKGG